MSETPAAGPVEGSTPAARHSIFAGKLWFWLPVLPLVALDLWSKAAVFAFMAERPPELIYGEYPVWDGAVSFHLVTWMNTGTVWGLFQGFNTVLVGLRFVALGVLIYFASRTPPWQRFQQFVLGLVMAGAVGNLYDNLTQKDGGVRDFLLFFVGQGSDRTVFPAFNVADSCITVGAIALVCILWRAEPPD